MSFSLRPLDQEADLGLYVQFMNASHPESKVTEAEQAIEFQMWPPDAFSQDWVMTQSGQPVAALGIFDPYWAPAPGRFELYWTGESVAIWEFALAHLTQTAIACDARELSAWNTSLRPELSAFLIENGFKLIERCPVIELDVQQFDSAMFADRLAKAEATGHRFCSVADLIREGRDWPALLHPALQQIRTDLPGEDAWATFSLERYRRDLEIGGAASYPPDFIWVAMDGDRVTAYSRLVPSEAEPDLMHTGMSGALREERRKGLVTALKVRCIQAAKAAGIKRIQTDNLELNPMLTLNYELGFRDRHLNLHYRWYRGCEGAE